MKGGGGGALAHIQLYVGPPLDLYGGQ